MSSYDQSIPSAVTVHPAGGTSRPSDAPGRPPGSSVPPADHPHEPADPPDSAPPFPPSSAQEAFRATFLWRFDRPEVVEAFRLVGDALFDLLNEAGAWGPDDGRPVTRGELRAVREDLDHLVGSLEAVAGDRFASELEPVAEGLAGEAGAWAERLRRLVAEMGERLGRADEELEAAQDPGSDAPSGNPLH